MWEKGVRDEVLIICESVKVIIPLCYWRGENTSLDVQFSGLRSNKSLCAKGDLYGSNSTPPNTPKGVFLIE